ncbi:hypothetical protein HG536_0E02420 [Torulaspora globosa]|uniref:Uncharacterized protein n=1 Tax=Torulaspora globosa TaxID=48254 RepID=A0A7G3ZIJ5_9SACH|nr:uncharacterized protein HG536_0E02420 [Torulaspora globosa]QLL33331.1 hypothetical protein HG536_0E02420 [Torulaspora globosa]
MTMLNGASSQEEAQMSPEKEQEIANRILKRAELAQMTRQLKMKLGKVPTSREASPVKVRKRRGDGGCDEEIKEAIAKVSPVKKGCVETKAGEEDHGSRSPVKQLKGWSTPPPAPPASSSSLLPDRRNQQEIPTTPRRVKGHHHTVPPAITSSSSGEDVNSRTMALLATPKNRSLGRKLGTSESDVGADLLMYLATSPYLSAATAGHQPASVPSTPRNYMSSGVALEDSHDAIRFSHMKHQTSSPQSTFKAPTHFVRHGTYSQGHAAQFPPSSSELLMDSPAIYMAASSSPQKRRQLAVQPPTNVPTTPSRELRSSSHLWKTPNFNMGDYVHALFSPSPRVTSSATSRPSSTHDMRSSKS